MTAAAQAHAGGPHGGRGLVVCADFGSTYTKLTAVDLGDGTLVGTASHPTTVGAAGDDVLDGYHAARTALADVLPGADLRTVRACSSAGGGLRLAVVGYERVVTAEAGHRVGLSAGSRVVHVAAGALDRDGVAALEEARPDVVLLCGGTDGGNAEVLAHNAGQLAGAALPAPVVVAGNIEVRDEVCGRLARSGKHVIPADNVLPAIGHLRPGSARAAIREVFIRHVIGGKGLSRSPEFAAMVRAATPDAVLAGVEVLADGAPGGAPGVGEVVVVDVGGATSDVYSVVTPADESERHREVVEVLWRGRTVEGDLGMRWSAPGVVAAAARERLLDPGEEAPLLAAAETRAANPGLLAATAADTALDGRLAALALTVALRRHARPSDTGPGKDLSRARLVVGSGGVFRHADPARLPGLLSPALTDHAGGWRVPERARLAVDRHYVLAAAGLLVTDHPAAAARLVRDGLVPARGENPDRP